MEFPFSNATVSAHVHATEEEQRVLSAMRTLVPETVDMRRSRLKGHYGNPILSIEAKINQKKSLRELWLNIVSRLRTGELDRLHNFLLDRLDDSCNLYLRFDKQFAYKGELVFTESGDAIHLRLKVVAFPAKHEVAIGLIEKFMGWKK